MDRIIEEPTSPPIGIKVYGSPPPHPPPPPSPQEPPHVISPGDSPASEGGGKCRALAKGVQKTLTKTSMLVNFLPTGTLLTFEMILPTITKSGQCSDVHTLMIHILLAICALSCFFFHFTDSFRGSDGAVYYGFVTPNGLSVFKPGIDVEVPKEERFKVSLTDFVHAIMSVMVFVAIAFSDHRVTDCLFPGHETQMDQVMESFPLMVGIVCSGLFLLSSNARHGIGCTYPI